MHEIRIILEDAEYAEILEAKTSMRTWKEFFLRGFNAKKDQ